MSRPVQFNDMVDSLVRTLQVIPGVGRVDGEPGGISTFIEQQRAAFLWSMQVMTAKYKRVSFGPSRGQGTFQRDTCIWLEGWYPQDVDNGSHLVWRPMLDAVLSAILGNRSLGLGVILARGPILPVDSTDTKSSLHIGERQVLCHYVRIILDYTEQYSTSWIRDNFLPSGEFDVARFDQSEFV